MTTTEDTKFMKQLDELAKKSRCIRIQIGAMIVKDGKVLVEGCNDIPHDEYDCRILGCIRTKEKIPSGHEREVCRGLCAEQYVISKAAERGIALNNTTMYTSVYPCRICSSLILNAGINRVVYRKKYPEVIQEDILEDGGIEVCQVK